MSIDEYAKIAPYYERLLSRFLDPIRKNISTFVHYQNHTKILDVCCGTGQQLLMIRQNDTELTGVDSSKAMLNQAPNNGKITFIQLDATTMDLPVDNYDAVLLTFALHEKRPRDRQIILQKCWDLVRPGGHLILCDYCNAVSTIRGLLFKLIIIPFIERIAGKVHYIHYKHWMQSGAIEQCIDTFQTRADIVSMHFFGSVMTCSLRKETDINSTFRKIPFSL